MAGNKTDTDRRSTVSVTKGLSRVGQWGQALKRAMHCHATLCRAEKIKISKFNTDVTQILLLIQYVTR